MTEQEVERLMHQLGQKADDLGLSALEAPERTVLLAWWARGVIGNGGFKYFFEGGSELGPVAREFRALGFPKAAEACERVDAEVVAEGRLPHDEAARRAALARVDWRRFEADEREIFAVKWELLSSAIGRYVETHGQTGKAGH
jgi:uncharacterized protein DUF4375